MLRAGQLVVLESTTYPGTTTDYTIRTTPKLVGGMTAACTERAHKLYALVCDEVVVSAPRRPSFRSCWRTSSAPS